MTKILLLPPALFLSVLGISLAGVADARAPKAVATAIVDWGHQPERRVAVDKILWQCVDETCRGIVVDTPGAKLRACYRLANRVGPVLHFETASGALSDEELARCNDVPR